MWWPFGGKTEAKPMLYLHNSLSGEKELFEPLNPRVVKMYNCGPTAYDVAHIGNLRSYVFADTVRRALEFNGFNVKQAINITDFGHLQSDGDSGDDKMTKALKREKKDLTLENMRALAEKYTEIFIDDLNKLGVDTAGIQFPRASDHVPGQIAIIRTLEEKGYAYQVGSGVYFDTARFPQYGKLGNINLQGLQEGARVAAQTDKRNPTDFLLWKSDDKLGWDSPWGKGFPGWHIECSAMIHETLGWQIDIHTGGIDLLPTHHNNEIAQSESASGKKPFSKYWLHHEFLTLKDEKISKSVGNIINLEAVVEKGFHPRALRYLYLTTHYRSPANFTWDALQAAQQAYLKLVRAALSEDAGSAPHEYLTRFRVRLNDDLDTPGAIAVLWEALSDTIVSLGEKKALLLEADKALGLGLTEIDEAARVLVAREFGVEVPSDDIPEDMQRLLDERNAARAAKDWAKADELRDIIAAAGYEIKDTVDGSRLVKR